MPRKPKTSPKKIKKPQKEPSVDDILEAAGNLAQEPEQAVSLYTAAILRLNADDPRRIQCLELRGEAYVSMLEQELAFEDFRAAKELFRGNMDTEKPADLERLASINLYLAQLSEGSDAVPLYEEAISSLDSALLLVKDAMETSDGDSTALDIRRQLSAACCSAAELYMTDLCYDEDAEQKCESFVSRAKLYSDSNGRPFVDALQSEASLRLSQIEKRIQAIEPALEVFNRMSTGCRALSNLVGLRESQAPDQARELVEIEAVNELPGFEFRCQTAKILLECCALAKESERKDISKQCNEAAIDVLGSLLSENDEVVEIYSLLGDAYFASDPSNHEAAHSYWERAIEMLQAVKSSISDELAEAEDDEELQTNLDEVVCQIEELGAKIADLPNIETNE